MKAQNTETKAATPSTIVGGQVQNCGRRRCPRHAGTSQFALLPVSLADLNELPGHEVVRQLDYRDALAHAPVQHLLVQRNVADVVLVQFHGLVDHDRAPVVVDLRGDLVGQLIQFGVAVEAQVELAAATSPGVPMMGNSTPCASTVLAVQPCM